MKWKTNIAGCLCCLLLTAAPVQRSGAAVPIAIAEVIRAGVKRVIRAVDLRIQRLQNQTIWLQNAQKTLENTLSKLKLEEIGEWTRRQKEQYQQYFDELHRVRTLISYYQRIRDITEKQARLVAEYQRAWAIIRIDGHFRPDEIDYMARVYSGILRESVGNLEQLSMVVSSFRTQMPDAKRLEIINEVSDRVDGNFADLRAFNTENARLSIGRSRSGREASVVKQLYGLE